jgi:hypothetical protein
MLNVIFNGLMTGVVLSVLLLFVCLFIVCKFSFRDYLPTAVYCVVAKDTPLWYMVAGVMTLSVIGHMGYWGVIEGGPAKAAVFWGIGIWIATFALYRVLWAVSVVGFNPRKWNDVWHLTRTKGNVHRTADQKISFVIVVVSAILTTWMAMQGVYG